MIALLSEPWVLRSCVVIAMLGLIALTVWIAGEGHE